MKNINDNVFLHKIAERIKNGDFDVYLTMPFQTRELFLTSIKGRLMKKIATNGTPLLSDAELKDCLAETKETAVSMVALYLELGFMERTETGFELTERYYKAIKAAYNKDE